MVDSIILFYVEQCMEQTFSQIIASKIDHYLFYFLPSFTREIVGYYIYPHGWSCNFKAEHVYSIERILIRKCNFPHKLFDR